MIMPSPEAQAATLNKWRIRGVTCGVLFFTVLFALMQSTSEVKSLETLVNVVLCVSGVLATLGIGYQLDVLRKQAARGDLSDERWQHLTNVPRNVIIQVITFVVPLAFAIGAYSWMFQSPN